MRKTITKVLYKIRTSYKTMAVERIANKQFVYTLPQGYKMLLNVEKEVDREIYIGAFESKTITFFRKLISENMTVFDIGANIGYYSVIAASKLKGTGAVYAFEPALTPYTQFSKTIIINGIQNVELLQKGVAETTGQLEFNMCADDAYNSLGSCPMDKIQKTTTIEVVSIDDFCHDRKIDKIDIMKIDTEGAEYLVLKGGKTIFAGPNAPILFCEYNRSTVAGFNNSLRDLDILIKSYGYTAYELCDGLKEFDPLTSTKNEIICLKDIHLKFVADKLN